MRLSNETPHHALLLSSVIDDDRLAATITVRVTYEIDRGQLRVAPEQRWTVSAAPWDSPRGKMEGDQPFMKGGVDVFVFGSARTPDERPLSEMQVSVELGSFVRRANVFGERIWVRRNGKDLVASRPGVFVDLPLTLNHAFGGVAEWDGLAIAWPENPAGKGFCVDESKAEGTKLPNLEEPDAPARHWNERATVCGFGFCPMPNAARFKNGWELSPDNSEIVGMRPLAFNSAFVPMVAPTAKPGDIVRLRGVDHRAPVEFALPAPPAMVKLQFGANAHQRALRIDQVGVEVDERRVFVSWQFAFRYAVRPREMRRAWLVESASI